MPNRRAVQTRSTQACGQTSLLGVFVLRIDHNQHHFDGPTTGTLVAMHEAMAVGMNSWESA